MHTPVWFWSCQISNDKNRSVHFLIPFLMDLVPSPKLAGLNPFTTDRPKGSLDCIDNTNCRVVTNKAVSVTSLPLCTSITSTM